jgi:hypothetical protein
MTLLEHDGYFVSLENSVIEKYYYQIFYDKPRNLKEAIRCSWSLAGGVPFTISMTAGDKRFGKINVEIKEGKGEASESEPIRIELSE